MFRDALQEGLFAGRTNVKLRVCSPFHIADLTEDTHGCEKYLIFLPVYTVATLWAADHKHLESFEMWCWRMEKISWTDHVRNEDVLLRVKEQTNILYEISKRKFHWIGHILRINYLLQRDIEGKIKGGIEVTQEDEEEDIGSYWMTLRKGEDTFI